MRSEATKMNSKNMGLSLINFSIVVFVGRILLFSFTNAKFDIFKRNGQYVKLIFLLSFLWTKNWM